MELREEARSSPIEEQVFVVRARLVGIKEEQDRDVHIVIADLDDDSATMIVEIPSPMCAGACASGHASEFEAARDAVETRCGPPRERFETVAGEQIVTVTGIGFFDFLHRQRGVAPNGIELHPVLSVQFE